MADVIHVCLAHIDGYPDNAVLQRCERYEEYEYTLTVLEYINSDTVVVAKRLSYSDHNPTTNRPRVEGCTA